ncbi:STAS domain-containing protein, partial [Polaromonas sp.]|uniref:STAS domain-containing protein n=1 Tax=Polaromonas sp. TaxID=1869339 RepID=UPI0037535C06
SDGKAPASSMAANWICPSTVGIQTIAALKVALAKASMPWCLDWSNLKAIDAAAVEPLGKVFGNWSAQPVQLRFMGDANLQKVLQNATPSGQRETPQEWWHLRMEALRVTHRPDEFELAALDFCVTYEVSPPAWESARCDYKAMDLEQGVVSGHTIIGDVYRDSVPSIMSALDSETPTDSMNAQINRFSSVELSGQVHGDAVAVLEQLEDKLKGADILVISCAKLIRVDFSAAGTLLNWVSAREAESRTVQFVEVNRLVAAFFNVIGITEHAKVMTRRD